MKKTLFILTACMFFLTSCSNEKQFDGDLQMACQKTNKTFQASTLVCKQISDTRRTAIFDNKTPSGKYCSDFNEALKELFESYSESGILDSINSFRNSMQVATSKLNNPPSSRTDCYNDFVEIVSDVSSISRMATDPTGSLSTYYSQVNETAENISKKIDRFKIKYAQFIKFGEEY